jgi:hypothetical protein
MKIDFERLGRELLDQLRTRQGEIEAEHAANTEMITAIEKRLAIETATPAASVAAAAATDFASRSAPPSGEGSRAIPTYKPEVFFNLSQKEAVIKLLKLAGRPMPMLEIIDALKKAQYPFSAQSVYQSLFGILRRAPEVTKHGKLFGLKEWSRNGSATTLYSARADGNVDERLQAHDDRREQAEREFEESRERLKAQRQAHGTDEE